jgi:hypothetical protein
MRQAQSHPDHYALSQWVEDDHSVRWRSGLLSAQRPCRSVSAQRTLNRGLSALAA